MKRLLIIYGAIVIAVVLGGIIIGKIFGTDAPVEDPKTTITYIDENGNEITDIVDDKQVEVVIDGQKYKYNAGIWKGQPFKIGSDTFTPTHYMKNFRDKGYKEALNGAFEKDGKYYIYPDYNLAYDYLFTIKMYSEVYNEAANRNAYFCEDVVLPANVRLGVSTKEYVDNIYGEAFETNFTKENIITVKYYATADKRGERLVLYYTKDTQILCGIEWSFDVRDLS